MKRVVSYLLLALRAFGPIGFNWSLGIWFQVARTCRAVYCSLLQKPRTAFVETVSNAFERFDSAPGQWIRGSCHMFVK